MNLLLFAFLIGSKEPIEEENYSALCLFFFG